MNSRGHNSTRNRKVGAPPTTIPSVGPMGVPMPRAQREEEIIHSLDLRPNFLSFLAYQHSLETLLSNNPNGCVSSTPAPNPTIPKAFSDLPQGFLQGLGGCFTSALERVQPAGGHCSSAGLAIRAKLSDGVPDYSCNQGSSLNPISHLDSCAGILHDNPVQCSSPLGQGRLLAFVSTPNPGLESRPGTSPRISPHAVSQPAFPNPNSYLLTELINY